MTTVKRINGDYLISNKGTVNANVTLSTHTVYVDGNLVVGGNSTSVSKQDLSVTDNIITLNDGETGAGVTLLYSGIEIDRGSLANVGLRWNETVDRWQLTTDGITYANIAAGGAGGALSAVIDDPKPQLGGNLNITGNALYSTTANVVFYANTVNNGGGGSGVYVNDLNGTNQQELITQSRALTYSIIFG